MEFFRNTEGHTVVNIEFSGLNQSIERFRKRNRVLMLAAFTLRLRRRMSSNVVSYTVLIVHIIDLLRNHDRNDYVVPR